MTIELTAAAYTIPTDLPGGDGTLSWTSTTLVVVQATSGGVTGLGYTYGPAAVAAVVGDLLAAEVVDLDPDDIPAAWLAMQKALRNAGRVGVAGLALSAADCALWDLKALRREMPLHTLLGSVRRHVPVYGSGGLTTYSDDQLRDQLLGWLDQGVGRVKIKIAEAWGTKEGRDLDRITQARDTVGSAVELFVDANGGYTRKQAIRILRSAADLDVRWFEEPVSSDDLAGLAEVRDAVDADVTAGEYGFDLPYFQRLAPVVDCLQVDVTRCGGITEFLRAAAVAASHGLDVSAHCAPHQHLAVAAAVPNLRHVEWFHDHVRIETMLFDGASQLHEGAMPLGDSPGNGLTFKVADAAPYRSG